MFVIPDLSEPLNFLLATLVVFIVVVGRYFLIAGIFFLGFYVWSPARFKNRKINEKAYSKNQMRKEIKWSTVTAMIFAVSGAGAGLLWQKGYLKIYMNVFDYPLWWIPLSFIFAVLIHETYYYWLHRWMHHPRVFRVIHKVHHESNITSPWTAFSFHPLEGLLQALSLPLLMLILPMHLYVLIIQLTFMTFSSVINHLDIEIYPKQFHKHLLGRWLIGATHHSLHHKQFKYNFGLYFTFWDKFKKTESPAYHTLFEQKTGTLHS